MCVCALAICVGNMRWQYNNMRWQYNNTTPPPPRTQGPKDHQGKFSAGGRALRNEPEEKCIISAFGRLAFFFFNHVLASTASTMSSMSSMSSTATLCVCVVCVRVCVGNTTPAPPSARPSCCTAACQTAQQTLVADAAQATAWEAKKSARTQPPFLFFLS